MLSRSERMKRARITLARGGQVEGHLIAPLISESWSRCIAAGLDPYGTPPQCQLTARELRDQRQEDETVHRFAAAQIQALYQQIAGSNFMIAFGNARGTVLETVSDGAFRESKPGRTIVPGSIWQEESRGTNAMGTTAIIRQPLIVHGEEHFFINHSDVSCFAAPVFHSNGELAGVLDASSDCRARNQHTLVLIQMASTHIENSLFLTQQREHTILLFHSRPEMLNSVSGGLIAFDQNGILVAINQRGRAMLSGLPTRPGAAFESIFEATFEAALSDLAAGRVPLLRDLLGSRYAVQAQQQQRREAPRPAPERAASPRTIVDGFVADDATLQREISKVGRAVHLKPPFLILGESGTGKEIMARHIHQVSGRAGAFVPVNCGALPEHLFESELFGYTHGAFTGARKDGATGLARQAHGGTLFLDEIGDLPMPSQVALLRFLDLSEVRSVGATQTERLDVQIVAATNCDLDAAITDKRFREDLYYRLGVVRLQMPPLRQRTDFQALARHVLAGIDAEASIEPDALAALEARPWNGNIRELRAALLELAILSDGPITLDDVAARFDLDASSLTAIPDGVGLRGLITRQVNDLLAQTGNNVSEVAKRLNVSRNTVYKYMRSRRLN